MLEWADSKQDSRAKMKSKRVFGILDRLGRVKSTRLTDSLQIQCATNKPFEWLNNLISEKYVNHIIPLNKARDATCLTREAFLIFISLFSIRRKNRFE